MEVKEAMNHAVAVDNGAAELLNNLGVPDFNTKDIIYSGDTKVGCTIEEDRKRRQMENMRSRQPLNQMRSYLRGIEREKAHYLERQEKARLKGKEYKPPIGIDFYDDEIKRLKNEIAGYEKALSERKKFLTLFVEK